MKGSPESARSLTHARRPSLLKVAVAALALLSAVGVWAAGPYVEGLTWEYRGRDLVASFGVGDALDRPDLKELIQSTQPVNLFFTVEVVKHRTLWKDKLVVRHVVVHTVRFDNLTRQYSLETQVDDKVTDRRAVGSWAEMASYMKEVKDLTLTSVANLEPSEGGYSIRVRVHVLTNFVLWIFPWDVQTPWVSQTLETP